ncbi:hypothetical protein MTO96_024933 [Rhipicephalus appendiculatus]
MDKCLAWIATFLCLLLLVEAMAEASPYSVAGDDLDDYNDNLARLLFFTRKRSCIRRGGQLRPPPERLLLQLIVPMQPLGNQLPMPEDGPVPEMGQEVKRRPAFFLLEDNNGRR